MATDRLSGTVANEGYVIAPIHGLINGISQQADGTRYAGQAEDQRNAWSTPNYGISKRNPTEYLGQSSLTPLEISGTGGLPSYLARTSVGDFLVSVEDDVIRVFGVNGQEYPVVYEGTSQTYLASADSTEVMITSKEDTIFILNKVMAVRTEPNTTQPNLYKAMVFIKAVTYRSIFDLTVRLQNGTEYTAQATVWDGSTTQAFATSRPSATGATPVNTEIPKIPQVDVRSNEVAEALAADLHTAIFAGTGSSVLADGAVKWDIRKSVIQINTAALGPIESVTITDSEGTVGAFAIFNEADSMDHLPLSAPRDTKVKVVGFKESKVDDFWVEFIPKSSASSFTAGTNGSPRAVAINGTAAPVGSGLNTPGTTPGTAADLHAELPEGYWEECADPTVVTTFDAASMPHKLTYDPGDGSFHLDEIEWDTRVAGDDDSNEVLPPLDGNVLTSIFFFRNRMGFATGTFVAFSEQGNYFNFFRTTVQNLVDSDPIGIDMLTGGGFSIKHSVAFEHALILFGKSIIYQLTGEPTLTHGTVSTAKIGEYPCLEGCLPVVVGRSLFFVGPRNNSAALYEMIRLGDSDIFDVSSASAHVPNLMSPEIVSISGSSASNCLVLLDSAGRIYLNQYLWAGNEKAQNAWNTWEVGGGGDVLAAQVIDSSLFLIENRSTDSVMTRTYLSEAISDAPLDYMVLLDQRIRYSPTAIWDVPVFDAVTGNTSILLPVSSESSDTLTIVGMDGEIGTIVSAVGAIIEVSGDWSYTERPDGFFIGHTYSLVNEFSKPILRNKSQQGPDTPMNVTRSQTRYGVISYNRSRSFQVEVERPSGDEYLINFNHPTLGQPDLGVVDGSFRFSVFRRSGDTVVRVINSSPYPSNIHGLEWEIKVASQRGTRFQM